MMHRSIAALCVVALLAGCSSHGSSLPPVSHAPSSPSSKGSIPTTFTIKIPPASASASSSRRPAYISPATQSIVIEIDDDPSTDSYQNVTSGAPGCTTVTPISPLTCTISISVTPGPHVFTMLTFDQPLCGGFPCGNAQPLSSNFDFPFTVVQGTNNNIPIVLQGLPIGVLVLAPSGQDVTGNSESGFSLWGAFKADGTTAYPRTFTVVPVDADGNYIIGPGAPALAMASSNSAALSDGVANPNNPNQFIVTPIAYDPSQAYDFIVSATPSTAVGTNSGLGAIIDTSVPINIVARNAPRIYVANSYSNTVSVYDEQGNTAIAPFAVGTNPAGMAYDAHDGLLYVTSGSGLVTAYDTSGNPQTLSGTFAGATNPVGIVYDPHNQHLYVGWPNTVGNTSINVYDEQGNPVSVSGTFVSGASVAAFAYGGVYNPDDGYLYFADMTNGAVWVYDEDGNTIRAWSEPNGPTSIARSASGSLYVATQSGTVDVFDTFGDPLTLPGGAFGALTGLSPWGLAYDPADGQYYASTTSGVLAFDLNGNARTLSGPFSSLDVPLGLTVVP